MISLSGVGMAFGTQVLFRNVTWRLHPGAHYGLVGANGTGKSTLLRLLAGELPPESGDLSRPNDLAIGTLGQDHFGHDPETLLQIVIAGRPRLRNALDEKAALLQRLGERTPGEAEGHRLAELEAVIADEDGYAAEARAATLLAGLGLHHPRHARPMAELSGGYRLRVLLARTLFAAPALLLLDEPTNHLDIDAIRWLEGYLRDFPGTFVIVSHDRHFLNAVCGHIADLDYQELRLYPGNYDAFLAAKELAVARKETQIARAEEKIAGMERFVERFRAKATKARQAQSRKKQIERIELPEIQRTLRRRPGFRFSPQRPSGKEVLRVKRLRKAFAGHTVLDGIAFTLTRGEKLAVVGPNGIGKSTLLKILCGELAPDEGEVETGYEVRLGYMAQDHRDVLRGRTSVYDWLYAAAPAETVGAIRGTLGRVLFSGDEVEKSVADLSGGEGARLLLAALMLRRDNLLVLDEPTNHLDLEGREALMTALRDFEGTAVFVSHDRHFVSSVGTRVLALAPGGAEDVPGTYEDYLAARGEDFLAAGRASPPRAPAPGNDAAARPRTGAGGEAHAGRKAHKKELGRLRKQVERLEAEVAALEAELAGLDERFAAPGYYDDTPWQQVRADQARQQEARRRLDGAVRRWEQAAARLERLQQAS